MSIYKPYILLFGFMSIAVGINAATLFVTTLDDGVPGSLRATIAAASGDDDILFDVSGTIFLDETLGELVVDKELNIDGQDKIVIDGKDQINVCFHITGSSAAFTLISNITIQIITATATALPFGSRENNNTSEVSNALAACKPNSTFCPCPEMIPDETCLDCIPSE